MKSESKGGGVKTIIIAALLLAHDWYPSHCCNGHDCQQVPCETIAHRPGYWVYLPTNVLFGEAQVSPDRYCHVCINQHYVGICLFAPHVNS
jgi:hypothetical protein